MCGGQEGSQPKTVPQPFGAASPGGQRLGIPSVLAERFVQFGLFGQGEMGGKQEGRGVVTEVGQCLLRTGGVAAREECGQLTGQGFDRFAAGWGALPDPGAAECSRGGGAQPEVQVLQARRQGCFRLIGGEQDQASGPARDVHKAWPEAVLYPVAQDQMDLPALLRHAFQEHGKPFQEATLGKRDHDHRAGRQSRKGCQHLRPRKLSRGRMRGPGRQILRQGRRAGWMRKEVASVAEPVEIQGVRRVAGVFVQEQKGEGVEVHEGNMPRAKIQVCPIEGIVPNTFTISPLDQARG